jgi:formate dehydrogenase maturation protein FdhE
MKVGDNIKKRIDGLNSLSDEELKEWADAMLEEAKNKTFVPWKRPRE